MKRRRETRRPARTRRLVGFESLEGRRVLDAAGLAVPDIAEGESLGDQVNQFSLEDLNPTSATMGQQISPADFQGQISAWYFGHST